MPSNEVFKALSDPTRREVLWLLGRGEMSAGKLAEKFDMTKPSIKAKSTGGRPSRGESRSCRC